MFNVINKENQRFYLDEYGRPRHYRNNSIQEYLIERGELPPDTIKLVTLNQLKEKLNELTEWNVTYIISKLGGVIKEYTEPEQEVILPNGELVKILKDGDKILLELSKILQDGDEILLEYDYGYGDYDNVIFIVKEEKEKDDEF